MNFLLILLPSLFPFNPKTDTSLGHNHLVLAYCVVWVVQLGYLSYLLFQWRSVDRTGKWK
jgi:uncharacterized membrane protein